MRLRSFSLGLLVFVCVHGCSRQETKTFERHRTLRSFRISELVEAILRTPGIEVTEKLIIASALQLYRIKNIDFIDAWVMEFAKHKGVKIIYTFDAKHFKGVSEIETRRP